MFTSREKYTDYELFQLFATLINQMNMLDSSLNSNLTNHIDAIKTAKEFIIHSKSSLKGFPWYPYKQKLLVDNELHESAIKYTESLQSNLKSQPMD